MIVRFYNRLTCVPVEHIEQIPPGPLEILAHLDYQCIIEPMIAADLRRGLSQRFVARRYGVTHHRVYSVGQKYKI